MSVIPALREVEAGGALCAFWSILVYMVRPRSCILR